MHKVEISEFNKETGEWETRIEEREGSFVFSTTSNVPRSKLEPKETNKEK